MKDGLSTALGRLDKLEQEVKAKVKVEASHLSCRYSEYNSSYILGAISVYYRVFIKYCFFSKILKDIPDSGLYRFPLVVSVCTQWQVKPQCLQQNWQSSEKSQHFKKNTISNEHPV